MGVGSGEGLWLFSRSPAPGEAAVAALRDAAAAKGFDLGVLRPVTQAGCEYAPFPADAAAGGAPAPFSGFSG